MTDEGTTALTTFDDDDRDRRRKLALMKAVGLDKLPAEQRELAVNLAQRYGLDLLLKHLVMIEGRAYITRDGLLHVAHRSTVLDGIEVTEPVLVDGFWRARCSVYRRDMSRPFSYSGRYPEKGRNSQYGPEMAVKVAEVATLRRAFDVSMATIEESWEGHDSEVEDAPKPAGSLAERVAQRRATVAAPPAQMIHVDPEPAAAPAAEPITDLIPEEELEVTQEELEELIATQPASGGPAEPQGVYEVMPGEVVLPLEVVLPVEVVAAEPTEDVATSFMRAASAAGVTRQAISAAARRAFPSVPSTAYNDSHWKGLADELGLTL